MSETRENPAHRLRQLINTMSTIPATTSVRQGWARVFNVSEQSYDEILLNVANVLQLIKETETAVRGINMKDHEVFLRPLRQVKNAVSTLHFGTKWQEVINQIDDGVLRGIDSCDQLFSTRELPDDLIAEDDIKGLLAAIDELRELVASSDLPDQLKYFFVEQLEKLRNAVLNYKLLGSTYLEQILANVMGTTFLHHARMPSRGKQYQDHFERFWVILGRTADLLQVLGSAPLLPLLLNDVKNLLS